MATPRCEVCKNRGWVWQHENGSINLLGAGVTDQPGAWEPWHREMCPARCAKAKVPHTIVHDPSRPSPNTPAIATLFQAVQRDRVGIERSLAEKPEVYDPTAREIYAELVKIEDRLVSYLNDECKKSPVFPWLSKVPHIKERLRGMLIGLIDIERCPVVSSLWRYSGLATMPRWTLACSILTGKKCPWESKGETQEQARDKMIEHLSRRHRQEYQKADASVKALPIEHYQHVNVAQFRETGQPLPFNNVLKKTFFLVARQFIMGRVQPYEGIYRAAKAKYVTAHPEWRPGRQDLAARRVLSKIFAQHLWQKWREGAGLPTRVPYIFDQDNPNNKTPHPLTGYIAPPEW